MDKLYSLWCWLQDAAPGLTCCQNAACPSLFPAPGWQDSHPKWIWMAREMEHVFSETDKTYVENSHSATILDVTVHSVSWLS